MTTQSSFYRIKNSFEKLIRSNKAFFIGFILFLIVSGGFLFAIEPGEEILFFSDRRTVFGDLFFKYFTMMGEELGYLICFVILLFFSYRQAITLPLTGFIVTIVANLTKRFFAHPRPASFLANTELWDQIQLVAGVKLNMSSSSSFPSGHTMAAFALYSLMAFFLPAKYWTNWICLAAAILVGISRIYLVQHFLKDVFLGAIIGLMIGMAIYLIQLRLPEGEGRWYNKRLMIKQHLPKV